MTAFMVVTPVMPISSALLIHTTFAVVLKNADNADNIDYVHITDQIRSVSVCIGVDPLSLRPLSPRFSITVRLRVGDNDLWDSELQLFASMSSLFVGTPKKTTDKLQRVLNAAVRLVSNTRKYDRGLTHIRRNVLHWLDVTDHVRFRVCVQVFKCLHGMAPNYLSTMCHRASRLPGRQNLRSANRGQLDVTRATLSSCGVRAFAHAGPSLWNTLPVHLKNRNLTLTTFMRHLNSYLFSQY